MAISLLAKANSLSVPASPTPTQSHTEVTAEPGEAETGIFPLLNVTSPCKLPMRTVRFEEIHLEK